MTTNKQNKPVIYVILAAIIFTAFLYATPAAANVFILQPDVTQNQSQTVSIPVTLNNSSSEDIYAIELNIAYDSNILTASNVSVNNSALEIENYLIEYNVSIPGMIYALFASSTSVSTGTGFLLMIDFTVLGDPGETCDITFAKAILNNDVVSTTGSSFVVSPNAAPTFNGIIAQTGDEDSTVHMNFTLNDIESNPCDIPLSFESSNETLITSSLMTYSCMSGDINLSMTPLADQSGIATITITATDNGVTSSRTFDLNITQINDSPELNNPISNRIATEGSAYAFTFDADTFTDVDSGDVLTYTTKQSNGSALPDWLSFNSATRTFSGTPTNNDVGTIIITLTATDNSSASVTDTFELTVNNTNSEPVLSIPIADQSATEDVLYSFTFDANTFRDDDIAYGDTLSYVARLSDGNPLPSWLTFDANNRTFSGTPLNSDVGTISINVIAEDTLNLSVTDTFVLTVENVNDAPDISDIVKDGIVISNAYLSINEDTVANGITFSISDIDDTNLTVQIVSSNTSLLPNSNIAHTCSNNNCSMMLTPLPDQNGSAQITITATDPHGQNVSSAFTLNVVSVNDQPVVTSISDQSINEDESVSGVSFTVTDIEDLPCSFNITASSTNTSMIPNTNINTSCSEGVYQLNITPSANQYGTANISISASDSEGLAASTSFNVTVSPINDAPSLSDISSQSLNEGESVHLSFIADDIESSTLTVNAVSADQVLISNDNLILSNNGDAYKIIITPNAYQAGQTEINISASDGILTTSKTFTITVNEVQYVISGHVSSYTGSILSGDIQNVVLALSGTRSYSTMTDAFGNYAFMSVRPGNYTLTAFKSDEISLDLADAIKILKGAVKLINLSCYEQIAADAYIDGYFGAFDAAKVARYVGGLENCLNNDCLFWQFIPEEISSCDAWPLIEIENFRQYINLNGDKSEQNFIGIGCGNVSQ